MMKQMKQILFGIILLILVPGVVSAAGLTCDNQVYQLTQSPDTMVFDFGGENYQMKFYDTAGVAKTFCLDPGGSFKHGEGGYVCKRMIDPTGASTGVGSLDHALDVAFTYAYANHYDKLSSSNLEDRAVGELVYRWLIFNYQLGSRKASLSNAQRYLSYYTMKTGGFIPDIWLRVSNPTQRQIVETANSIYMDAKAVGDQVLSTSLGGQGKSYESIKSQLPNEDFQYDVAIQDDASMGGRTVYTVTFNAPSGAEVWWDDFTFDVTGSARVESVDHASGSNVFVVRVQHSGQYTISANVRYYMPGSARTSMKMLKSRTNPSTRQDMLVVTSEPGSARTVIKGGQNIPLNGSCEYPGGDTSKVGIYCEYDSSGNKIPSTCKPDPEHCPPSSTPSHKTCSSENGVYYGVSGNVVTALVFYDECCESGLLTEEEYDLYCPCGKPDISFIGNCSEFNTANEVTNYVKDTRDNAHLKTCLFNNASTDAAGNTVRMSDQTTIVNNPYCKVGCVEEYEFTLPNAQYTTSGGYFSLSSAITGKRTCYVNASDSGKFNGIDHEKFVSDLFEASKALAEAQSTYNKLKKATESIDKDTRGCAHNVIYFNNEYTYTAYTATRNGNNIGVSPRSETVGKDTWTDGKTSDNPCTAHDNPDGSCSEHTCSNNGTNGTEAGLKSSILSGNTLEHYAAVVTAAAAKIQTIIKQYDDCTHGWENNFVFNPVTEFEYDEPYQNMSGFNNKFEKMGESSTASTGFCSGDVGDTYTCNGGDSTYAQTYVTCSNGSCSITSSPVSNSIYVKREKSTTATYQPKNKFGVYTPIGTIKLNEDTGLYTVLCKEENCLPVSLNAKTGVFNYKFKFSNVGQYNDSNANGRLMGGTNNVFDAVNIEAGYVCQYVNNCPECDYTCVGDKCDIDPDPSCPDCPYVCQNCVFDGSEMTYYYRTVSINNLFPNSRSYGPNWSNDKGSYTKKLVEQEGDEVYKDPEYSYTISANQMKRIREFNDSVGGYLNTQMPNGENALSCFDKGGYRNIYCTSTFLDTTGNTYFTQNKRNDQWTLWQDSGYFTSSTKYSLRDGEGPAWK